MDNYKYLEFLVEDKSGSILVEQIVEKYLNGKENIEYRVNNFKGIGKIPLNVNKISQVKTKRLLTDLPMYLKGMDSSLKTMPGKKAIFVVLDSDDTNCKELKDSLVEMYLKLELSIQVFFCIAIEEMEAWLLGDTNALLRAYPQAKNQVLQKYVQDSIVGTWEILADIVYKGGVQQLKKTATTYYEIGIFKCECAEKIGVLLDIKNNKSPSFNYFIGKLDCFCENGA